jgi:hypothetical protein
MEFRNKFCQVILPFYFYELIILIQVGCPDILTGLLKHVCMTELENNLYMNIYLMFSKFAVGFLGPKYAVRKVKDTWQILPSRQQRLLGD